MKTKWNTRNNAGFKLFAVLGLGILFFIPILMVRGVVNDRLQHRESAMNSILEPIGNNFVLRGVSVAVPTVNREISDDVQWVMIQPTEYIVDADLEVSNLKRGIFDVPIFNATLSVTGKFETAATGIPEIRGEEAFLIFDTGSRKNFSKDPEVRIGNNIRLQRQEKTGLANIGYASAFIYPISVARLREGFSFQITTEGRGGKYFAMLPTSGENTFRVRSDWPDPGFTGEWLPTEREVTDDGFSAVWEIAGFNVSIGKTAVIDPTDFYTENLSQQVRVSFLQINDIYTQVERSMKYAFLFIFIPFLALFFVESVRKTQIHPAQYLLIGIANILFYLLLLSLAEYIPFNAAYTIAMLMTVLLCGLYCAAIFRSKKTGILLGIVSLFAYLFLFSLLQLADYALLIGTLGLFAALAVIMFVTRNLDWYNLPDSVRQAVTSDEKKRPPADDPKTENRD